MTGRLLFCLCLFSLGLILLPMPAVMKQRPVEVKLGYLPHPQALKLLIADHGPLLAELATVKVLFYYGTIVGKLTENIMVRPELSNMFRTLQTAVHLDPYNEDAYYFTQAAFTWEVGRVREVNSFLEYGMRHRTWDHWLPFYIGFNYAYFLKEFDKAAIYMQKAAEISGNPLFAKLAARYFYESDQTALGLAFLDAMIANARDPAVKKTYQVRKEALLAVARLEQALKDFQVRTGRQARDLVELLSSGLIGALPVDPYGGNFYLDPDGRVRSTSKFANPNL